MKLCRLSVVTWIWLAYLYFSYFSHRSLGMITYNTTAGQLENLTTSPNPTVNNSEKMSLEEPQMNLTALKGELQTTKHKASVGRILYVTNNTAEFSKNSQITGRKNVYSPLVKTQRIQSGFGLNDIAYKPSGLRTFNSRSATKPSFETSRGKNWCAYVHTRLTPIVVVDSASSHVPLITDPCYWSRGGCQSRYQMMSRPTYKIKHKIITSLEWRCCPGYMGPQCQPKDSFPQTQPSDSGAEARPDSRSSVVTPVGSEQATEPAIQPKMDNEVTDQEIKLTKKVNDISTDMEAMKTMLSSLEEKLNTEKGDDLPSILKALKTKAIQEMLREIVQKEIKPFQSALQKSISNIISNHLRVSEDIEATKVSLKEFNKTMITLEASQSLVKASNTHMGNDIQNLKDQVSSLQDISVLHSNITTKLDGEYRSQMYNRVLEKQEEVNTQNHTFSQTLKTKAIQEMLREIVQKEIKPFQSALQKSISNIISNHLRVSEDIEATKVSLKEFNKTMITLEASQSLVKASNTHMGNDIQNLKDQVSSLQDISVLHSNITTKLDGEYRSQMYNRVLEKQEEVNTQNHTFSQSKTTQTQNFEGDSVYGSAIPDSKGDENPNLSEQVLLLGDAVRKQAMLTLQLQQDLHEQGLAVQNLTNAAALQSQVVQNLTNATGLQSHLAGETSETLVERCKQDLWQQIEEIRDSIREVNQTLCDKVNPMGDMMSAVEEKISHVSYDLEELKPNKENNAFADVHNVEKQAAELSAVKAQLESFATTINILKVSITGLEKAQEEFSNKTKANEDEVDKKLGGCQAGIEDSLNDTVTIINRAIDSVNDNHYILRSKLENTNRRLNEIYDDVTKKKNNSLLLPDIDFLNSTVHILQQKMERSDYLNSFDGLSDSMNQTDMNKPENLTHLSQQLTEALSKLEDHRTTIEHLQESHTNYSSGFSEHRTQLQRIESRINSLIYNFTLTSKPKKKLPAEMGLAWKYKNLNKRVEDLSIIMSNLTAEVLWLKESNQNARNLYQNMSILLDQQTHIPQVFEEHVNFTILKMGLNELLKQEGHDLCESVPMNPTEYLNCVLASTFKDISNLQRHAKDLDERLEATAAQNASSAISGRSQRNTDNIVNQVESQGCAHHPCQNGGTCIDAWHGYVCACRSPFGGTNCTVKLFDSAASPDFSKGAYRYAPMVTFFVALTYAISTPGPIRFNNLYVNYGVSYAPGSGKFAIPYLGVYVFEYTIEYTSSAISGYLVVDDVDKIAFRSQDSNGQDIGSRVISGDAVLELNYGQRVWLRLDTGAIPARYPPVSTFGGYILYRT